MIFLHVYTHGAPRFLVSSDPSLIVKAFLQENLTEREYMCVSVIEGEREWEDHRERVRKGDACVCVWVCLCVCVCVSLVTFTLFYIKAMCLRFRIVILFA